jgi:hypothetical protein
MLTSWGARTLQASLLLVLGVAAASAQLLNSERIEQTFGSYGIDVLFSDATHRLSNLYSEHDGVRITRTFAVVEYPAVVDESFAAEHREILAGGSIGATLQAAGWEVVKSNVSFSQIDARAHLSNLMGIASGTKLAAHLYRLDIAREGERYYYATIVEIHHPDYLRLDDLTTIYARNLSSEGPEVRIDLSLLLNSQRLIGELDLALGQ